MRASRAFPGVRGASKSFVQVICVLLFRVSNHGNLRYSLETRVADIVQYAVVRRDRIHRPSKSFQERMRILVFEKLCWTEKKSFV